MKNLNDSQLITLKEAAQFCGYSSDYIGQLIRAGKIPGKQVYSNVQWMTTAEAVAAYKNKGRAGGNESIGERLTQKGRRLAMEFNVIKLFFTTFRSALPLLAAVFAIFVLLSTYLLFSVFAHKQGIVAGEAEPVTQELSF